jgi:hypothetical protein
MVEHDFRSLPFEPLEVSGNRNDDSCDHDNDKYGEHRYASPGL